MNASTIRDVVKLQPSDELFYVHEDDTAREVAQEMADKKVSAISVLNIQGKLVGIISTNDVSTKVVAPSRNADVLKAKDIMSTSLVTCTLETTVEQAFIILDKNHIRHLPVVDNMGMPIAMVTSRDLGALIANINKALQDNEDHIRMYFNI